MTLLDVSGSAVDPVGLVTNALSGVSGTVAAIVGVGAGILVTATIVQSVGYKVAPKILSKVFNKA